MASRADFVISTITLTEETRGLFNRELFQSMKKTAFVINVSRGPVVNEHDLLQALDERIIAGAGLDDSREPLEPTSPLLSRDDVFATPHVAGATRQNYEGIARILADNLLLFKAGKTPRFCVNGGLSTSDGGFSQSTPSAAVVLPTREDGHTPYQGA
jgi:phosphoglycerate dehydrogenase-like enzyme